MGITAVVMFASRLAGRSETLDVTVSLQAGEEDVQEPQTQKEKHSEDTRDPRAAELSSDRRSAPEQQHPHADEGKDSEERDGEGQWPGIHVKLLALDGPIHGRHGPRHPDAQEHIYCVAARDVSHRGVCVLILSCGDFTCKRVWQRKSKYKYDKTDLGSCWSG